MKNIEKLGITPGPWRTGTVLMTKVTRQWRKEEIDRMEAIENKTVFANFHFRDNGGGRYRVASTENKIDANLIAAAPEMLEALIDVLIDKERSRRTFNIGWNRKLDNQILSVEKATGKSWEEIKELTNA